jgi:hypothetical protein
MSRINLFLQKSGGHIAVGTALIVVALLFLQTTRTADFSITAGDQSWLRTGLLALGGVGLIVLAICFPLFFWVDVNTDDAQKNEKRVSRLILYSYSVAALSLIGSLLPFLFVPSSFPGLYKRMLSSPVGIVLGCTQPDESQNQLGALDCTTPPYRQWVVNIGGMIVREEDIERTGQNVRPNASLTNSTLQSATIQGGLVIPLYFVVLSLIGGAISLTRRVPEYQRRYSVSYVPTEDKPKLDRATVREFLAFQILQFISAPLLAVVAYFLISPESKAALVALGFTAGFASEAVLLMTRALVEKISPANTIATQTGAVSGEVVDAAANNALLANASIAVVGKPNLVTQTDARGHFVIDGVAVGDQAIEASVAGRSSVIKVSIVGGKTAVGHITLP